MCHSTLETMCYELLSSFAFNFNVRRYSKEGDGWHDMSNSLNALSSAFGGRDSPLVHYTLNLNYSTLNPETHHLSTSQLNVNAFRGIRCAVSVACNTIDGA
jgi:hypothetical protein